jgi:hypothetical protein
LASTTVIAVKGLHILGNVMSSHPARQRRCLAILVLPVVLVGCNSSSTHPTTSSPVAYVAKIGKVPITRAEFDAAYQATTGQPPPKSAIRTATESSVLRRLVQDASVWIRAHQVGVAHGVTLQTMLRDRNISASVYHDLYDYAARNVPKPKDPRIAIYATLDQHTPSFLTPKQAAIYNAWQTRRDVVASAYFGRLLHSYARTTRYAAG